MAVESIPLTNTRAILKAATLAQIKKELQHRSPDELLALCLRLGRFKKENKELLTYLLFEAENEEAYVAHIKEYIGEMFATIRRAHGYYARKSSRRILKEVKKFIRYSNSKETEVVLLLEYCRELKDLIQGLARNRTMDNLLSRQLDLAEKRLERLHPDLQHDYRLELEELRG